jgi:hypothetical protein
VLGTDDDTVTPLSEYTREIRITELQPDLREVTVTVTYRAGAADRRYVLTTFVSNYS